MDSVMKGLMGAIELSLKITPHVERRASLPTVKGA